MKPVNVVRMILLSLVLATSVGLAQTITAISGAAETGSLSAQCGSGSAAAFGPGAGSGVAVCNPGATSVTVSNAAAGSSCTACIVSGVLSGTVFPAGCGSPSGTTFPLAPSSSWVPGTPADCGGGGGGNVSAPANVTVTAAGTGSATVTWGASTGGTSPYTYTVATTPASTLPPATSLTQATISELQTGTSYSVTVSVKDAVGHTATSTPVTYPSVHRIITIINGSSEDPVTLYMGVNNAATGLSNFQSCYTMTPQPVTNFGQNGLPPQVAQFTLTKAAPLVFTFTPAPGAPASCTDGSGTPTVGQISVAFSTDQVPWGPCPTSLAEFTLHGPKLDGISSTDTIDVSLVNGINKGVNISGVTSGAIISMTGAASPYNTIPGVYPPGCDDCSASVSPPLWANCPGLQPQDKNSRFTTCQSPFVQQAGNGNCQIPLSGALPVRNTAYTVTFIDAP